MTPSLYDLLDVDESATAAEIRAAWKAAIADLDPTDRRFRAFNQAAETLLDPEQRAAYDARLSAERPVEEAEPGAEVEPATEPEAEPQPEPEPQSEPEAEPVPEPEPEPEPAPEATPEPVRTADAAPPRLLPLWMVALAVVVAIGAVAATVWLGLRVEDRVEHRDRIDDRERGAQQAEAIAEKAIEPVLSYDYRRLEEDVARATPYLTDGYAEEYTGLIEDLTKQARQAKLVVKAEAIATGIIRSGDDRAEILVFVDQESSRDGTANDPLRMWVTLTMVSEGDGWLVDEMKVDTALPG